MNSNHQDRAAKIVVVGSINCDLTCYLESFPKKHETVLAKRSSQSLGGKGLNQAVAAARAGANVSFVGCVGEDQFGARALEYLVDNGIDTQHVRREPTMPTGTASIVVTDQGKNFIAVALGANACVNLADVANADEVIRQADVLVVQLEIPAEAIKAALSTAATHNVLSILNPAPATEFARENVPPT